MELRVRCKASLREEHKESLGLSCRERRAAGTTTETPTSYPCRQSSGENCSSADRRLSVEVHRDTSPRKALSQSHKVKHSPLAFKYINFEGIYKSSSEQQNSWTLEEGGVAQGICCAFPKSRATSDHKEPGRQIRAESVETEVSQVATLTH